MKLKTHRDFLHPPKNTQQGPFEAERSGGFEPCRLLSGGTGPIRGRNSQQPKS